MQQQEANTHPCTKDVVLFLLPSIPCTITYIDKTYIDKPIDYIQGLLALCTQVTPQVPKMTYT